jgi:hypothetical protein
VRRFQQRRRQDVADAGYRDVLAPVLEPPHGMSCRQNTPELAKSDFEIGSR